MKILSKEILSNAPDNNKIISFNILAPTISQKALPGQFVVLMISEEGERVPLTVVDCDKGKGSITIIFQEVGLTTRLLGRLKNGDSLYAIAGPLGRPTEVKNYGKAILVGGGVGIAEIYPVARALQEAGNEVTAILGARNKDLLILEKELKGVSGQLYVTTDDGSYGRKGFTTEVLLELLKNGKYDLVYTAGPIPMMKKVAAVTRDFKVKTIASLNAIMVDATGMCGCCRVSLAGQTKFSCVDGPEFDAQLVDWDGLIKRNRLYLEQEKHICRLRSL